MIHNIAASAQREARSGSRRTPTQALTFVARLAQHPSWALARVSNFAQRTEDRLRYADWQPPSGLTVEEGLRLLTGQDGATEPLKDAPELSRPAATYLYGSPDGSQTFVRLLYGLCRHERPEYVVETGVAHGFSSAAILQALSDNDRGLLLSIDLPHLHPRAIDSIGAVVDPALKNRWRLHLGPAAGLLKQLLPTVGEVGLAVHDAAHTVRGQLAEYSATWPYLRQGGLLVSDDVTQAFELFATRVSRSPIYIAQPGKPKPIGVLRR